MTVLVSLLGVGKVLGQEEFGQPVVYANNSATVMGQVTINGDPAGEGDVVAIYVGDELRGKQAVAINTGVAWLPNALINAKGGEETITFKVYDASAGVVVEKSATRPVIEPGKYVGTFTEPLLIKMDSKAPVITLLGEPEVQLELGSNYEDAGAQAEDNVDGDISNSIETVSTVDTNKPGTYTVTYNVEDSAGNAAATVTRLVEVLDPFGKVVVYSNNSATVLAQLSINGETAGEGDLVAIYVGDELRGKQVVAINAGAAWLTALVNAAGGEEEISFKVYDISAGEVLEKSGSTAVIEPGKAVGTFADPLLIKMDSVAPVITLLGEVEVSMEQGSEYEDAGATADDVVDGDLTANIVIGGNLDVWKVGTSRSVIMCLMRREMPRRL